MLIKGDKIKLIKKMGVFDNIGEICEVVEIMEGGAINFKFGKYNLGCMSYNEYEKYFEKVENVRTKWSEWMSCALVVGDAGERYEYKTNNTKVLVRLIDSGLYKSKSSCYKEDKFDLALGIKLAIARSELKAAQQNLDEIMKNVQ